MSETYGDYEDAGHRIPEYLQIGFSPSSISLQERWRNNGLSADFLGDYLSTFFPGDDPKSAERRMEVKDAVSYVANELLENAMKFTYLPSENPVDITMKLDSRNIIFYVSNSIDPATMEQFRQFINQLVTEDPQELYMEQMLANADDDIEEEDDGGVSGSGLGFLTMLNDYEAKLGWRFENTSGESPPPKVTTMVKLIV